MAKRRRMKKLPMYLRLRSKNRNNTAECALCPTRTYIPSLKTLANGKRVCPSCFEVIKARRLSGFCWSCNVRQGFIPHGLCGTCYILDKRGQLPKLTSNTKYRYLTVSSEPTQGTTELHEREPEPTVDPTKSDPKQDTRDPEFIEPAKRDYNLKRATS